MGLGLKRLEKETGAKVQVHGTKADTGQKVEITPSDGIQAAHEELYLHISAETFEKVDAAVALIELLVTPVSGNPAVVSTTPTSVSGDNVNVHNQSHKWFDGIDWKRMADSEGAPNQTSLAFPCMPTIKPRSFLLFIYFYFFIFYFKIDS